MAVGIYSVSKIVVQGITGKEGSFHAKLCKEYGGRIVAGVTPGRGGTEVEGIPVYDTVREAREKEGCDMSLIFVPPLFAADAILEAVFAGVETVVCITEGIPVHDMMKVKRVVDHYGTTLIGPNTPGIITPGSSKAGIMPGHIFEKGGVGMISRSGTLLYEAADQLVKSGLGISSALGIGGDPIVGTGYIHWLEKFENDPETEAVLLIGEIGGTGEEMAAEYIKNHMKKPVFAFISGRTAPKGKRMGHAGAIISGKMGTAESKDEAFQDAGVTVVQNLAKIGSTLASALRGGSNA